MKLLQLCFALVLVATFSSCAVYDHGGYSSQGYSRGTGYSPFTRYGYDDRIRHSQLRRSAFYDDYGRYDRRDRHHYHDHHDHDHDRRPSSSSSSSKKSSSSSNRSSSSRSSGSSSSKKSSSSSSSKRSSSSSSGGSKKSSSSASSRGVKSSPRNTPPRLR